MAYHLSDGKIGYQKIADTSATKGPHALGTVIRAVDPTYGEGEFIYLLGVANTTVGLVVSYNATTYQTTLSGTTAAQGHPVAVAMSANVASQYGWYQIGGVAVVKKTAVPISPQVKLYVSGTSGRLYATASAGKLVHGAKSANLATIASATSTVAVLLDRPHLRGVTSAI